MMEQIAEEAKEEVQVVNNQDKLTKVKAGQQKSKGEATSRCANRHKQVECNVCYRKMKSNNLTRHMKIHQKLYGKPE